ncbi:hypothetical protein [Anaeromyxobacter paludicola]|uniref:Uncharacterized protein n=1 Tax=Anaeromyxobacter paludicola TaxID=2918171 RepID=A0ABM7X589_9BACT|nr:hypothetical protein [Anaeromyxobacter paludicola]BDG06987.1 hypothetical protein AMPC_01000 [Anaeromyxobacter paludicola]
MDTNEAKVQEHTAAAEELEAAISAAGAAVSRLRGVRAELMRDGDRRWDGAFPTEKDIEVALWKAGLISGSHSVSSAVSLGERAREWAGRVG